MNQIAEPLQSDAVTTLTAEQLESLCSPSINQVITRLRESGADRFDPVRFRYITSLSQRASNQRAAVSLILEEKALTAFAEYQADFVAAKQSASRVVDRAETDYVDDAETIRQLFSSGNFRAIERLTAKSQRVKQVVAKPSKAQNPNSLTELTLQLNQGEVASSTEQQLCPAGTDSVDDILRQQEDRVLQSHDRLDSADAKGSQQPMPETVASQALNELKSAQLFRDSWTKLSYDKLVRRAIKEAPENPGPLNPQMLVIRSLVAMRDLSPEYLNRFVAYIDTLLWLDQAGGSTVSGKQKKNRGSKSKRRVKS